MENAQKIENIRTKYLSAIQLSISEGQIQWSRFNTILLINTILFAILGFTNLTDTKISLLQSYIPIIGFTISFLWGIMTIRGFDWTTFWIMEARKLEKDIKGNINILEDGAKRQSNYTAVATTTIIVIFALVFSGLLVNDWPPIYSFRSTIQIFVLLAIIVGILIMFLKKYLVTICLIFGCILSVCIYIYSFLSINTQYQSNSRGYEIASNLSLQVLSGFIFALIVFLIGKHIEEKRNLENRVISLKQNQGILIKLLRSLFTRRISPLNFANEGPNFYFDRGRINQVNDLLTDNNRYWQKHIVEYLEIVDHKDLLSTALNGFIDKVDEGLINVEKLDSALRHELYLELRKYVTATGQFDSKKATVLYKLFIYRATWAGATEDEILTGYIFHSPLPTNDINVKNAWHEAKEMGKNISVQEYLNQYQKDYKMLTNMVTEIEIIINELSK